MNMIPEMLALSAIPLVMSIFIILHRVTNRDIIEQIQTSCELEYGHPIETVARKSGVAGMPMFLMVLAFLICFGRLDVWGVVPFMVWIFAHLGLREYNYTNPRITQFQAQQRMNARHQQTHGQAHASGFGQADSDDGFYDYQQQGRAGAPSGGSSARSSQGSEHYGFDKRHPADKALWAVVDDPNATDGERQAAFSMLLKKQAQRAAKGQNRGATA